MLSRRPPALSAALIVGTMLLGLMLRFAHLGLRPSVVKYGGSVTWALCIYWLVSATLAPSPAALLSLAAAFAVEFFKLVRSPALDTFRHTLPGILLLGRIFSFADLIAYTLAILLGLTLDTALRQPAYSSPDSSAR